MLAANPQPRSRFSHRVTVQLYVHLHVCMFIFMNCFWPEAIIKAILVTSYYKIIYSNTYKHIDISSYLQLCLVSSHMSVMQRENLHQNLLICTPALLCRLLVLDAPLLRTCIHTHVCVCVFVTNAAYFVLWDIARATSAAMKGSVAIRQANSHIGNAVMQRDATQRNASNGRPGSHKSANKQEEPQEVRQAKCSILEVLN